MALDNAEKDSLQEKHHTQAANWAREETSNHTDGGGPKEGLLNAAELQSLAYRLPEAPVVHALAWTDGFIHCVYPAPPTNMAWWTMTGGVHGDVP